MGRVKAKRSPRLGRRGRIGESGSRPTALVLLVAVIYAPAIDNGFIWDDAENLEDNPALKSLSGLRDISFRPGATPQYYPLTQTSFWIESITSGSSTARLSPGEPPAACGRGGAGVARLAAASGSRGRVRGHAVRGPPDLRGKRGLGDRTKKPAVLHPEPGCDAGLFQFSPPDHAVERSLVPPAGNRRYYALALLLYAAACCENGRRGSACRPAGARLVEAGPLDVAGCPAPVRFSQLGWPWN